MGNAHVAQSSQVSAALLVCRVESTCGPSLAALMAISAVFQVADLTHPYDNPGPDAKTPRRALRNPTPV